MPEAPQTHPYWFCPRCFAINDSTEDGSCWNCETPFPSLRKKNLPWVEMGKEKCQVCGKSYVTWTLPAGTTMKVPEVLGLCKDYFVHYGNSAYFPPMLPLTTILKGNNWTVNKSGKVVTRRKGA